MMNCCWKRGIAVVAVLLSFLELSAQYTSMGNWDENGLPDYLEPEGVSCSVEFWERLNQALPERVSLVATQPDVLESADHDLFLVDSAQVRITFIHEGAGWKNSLFYYTYTEENPNLDSLQLTLVFPNSSLEGSGGALSHGDQVILGDFPAGTHLGFGLVARGWQRQSSSVQNNLYTVYSNPEWNPEPDNDLKQHSVLLSDPEREMVLIGFEDIRRDWQSCDQDFNDCVFGININPFDDANFQDLPQLSENNSPCYSVPEGLGASEIKLYKSTVSWEEIAGAEAYRVRFRKWNSNDEWEYRNAGSNTSLTLGEIEPLNASTHYEWQVAVTCNGVQTGNSVKHVFTTLSPCHMSLGSLVSIYNETSVRLHWTSVVGSENYQVRFRKLGEEEYEWRNSGPVGYLDLFDLEPGATYQWNVQTHCNPLQSCFAPYLDHYEFTMPLNAWSGEERSAIDCSERGMDYHFNLVQTWNYNLEEATVFQNDSRFLVFEDNGLHCLADGSLYFINEVSDVEFAVAFAMNSEWKILMIDQFGFRVQVLDQQGNTEFAYLGDEQWTNAEWDGDGFILTEMNHHKLFKWDLLSAPQELIGAHGLKAQRMIATDVSGDGHVDLVCMDENELHFVLNRSHEDTMQWVSATYPLEESFGSKEFAHQLTNQKWILPLTDGRLQTLQIADDQLFFETTDLIFDNDLLRPKFTFDEDLGVALFCAWNQEEELCYGWWDFVNDELVIEGTIEQIEGEQIQWIWFDNHWMISVLNRSTGVSWFNVEVNWQEVITEVWTDKASGLLNVESNQNELVLVDQEKLIQLSDVNFEVTIAKGKDAPIYLELSHQQCANHWQKTISQEHTIEVEEQLKVFPNPVQNSLNIEVGSKFEGACQFEIYTSNGREVMKGLANTYGASQVDIDVSLLASGAYVLRFFNEANFAVTNFVKIQ